jgi:hypothetical protein
MLTHEKLVEGETIAGVERHLTCALREGKVFLRIHSPGSDENGWAMVVDPADLLDAAASLYVQSREPARR